VDKQADFVHKHAPPAGTLGGKIGANFGDTSVNTTKEEIGLGVEGGLGLAAGAKITTTPEGLSGAWEFVTETGSTLKNAIVPVPTPPTAPPPQPPPCVLANPKTC